MMELNASTNPKQNPSNHFSLNLLLCCISSFSEEKGKGNDLKVKYQNHELDIGPDSLPTQNGVVLLGCLVFTGLAGFLIRKLVEPYFFLGLLNFPYFLHLYVIIKREKNL